MVVNGFIEWKSMEMTALFIGNHRYLIAMFDEVIHLVAHNTLDTGLHCEGFDDIHYSHKDSNKLIHFCMMASSLNNKAC